MYINVRKIIIKIEYDVLVWMSFDGSSYWVNSIIRGKFWWGEVGLLFDVDCFKFLEVLLVRKVIKGEKEEEIEKLF